MSSSNDEVDFDKHPSFGIVQFSRTTGGHGRLFGSHLEKHHETIRLRVSRGCRKHDLSHDWFYSGDLLLEVSMSPAQFAQLLTSVNFGSGVPCTIKFLSPEGEGRIESMPEYESEQMKILKGFEENLASMIDGIPEKRKRLDELLGKKNLTKKDRKEISDLVRDIFMWFEGNAGFAFKSFEEAAERVVTAAKAQVEEFALSTLVKVGMSKLVEKFSLPGGFGGVRRGLPEKK